MRPCVRWSLPPWPRSPAATRNSIGRSRSHVTFLAGLFCIAASFLKLGAMADFLSKPILVGFLNGVAINICLGQIGKLTGFAIESEARHSAT